MSKPTNSDALMTPYAEGRFELSDPVAKFLPELTRLLLPLFTANGGRGVSSDGTISRGVGTGDSAPIGQARKPLKRQKTRERQEQ